jgi:hypothetical protein
LSTIQSSPRPAGGARTKFHFQFVQNYVLHKQLENHCFGFANLKGCQKVAGVEQPAATVREHGGSDTPGFGGKNFKQPERLPEPDHQSLCDPFRVGIFVARIPGVFAGAPTPGYHLASLWLAQRVRSLSNG